MEFALESHLLFLISDMHIDFFVVLVDISAFISICNQPRLGVDAGTVWHNIFYINNFNERGTIWL